MRAAHQSHARVRRGCFSCKSRELNLSEGRMLERQACARVISSDGSGPSRASPAGSRAWRWRFARHVVETRRRSARLTCGRSSARQRAERQQALAQARQERPHALARGRTIQRSGGRRAPRSAVRSAHARAVVRRVASQPVRPPAWVAQRVLASAAQAQLQALPARVAVVRVAAGPRVMVGPRTDHSLVSWSNTMRCVRW